MSNIGIDGGPLYIGRLTTTYVADSFEGFISAADEDVENFITDNTNTGNVSTLIVGASTVDGRPKYCSANSDIHPERGERLHYGCSS